MAGFSRFHALTLVFTIVAAAAPGSVNSSLPAFAADGDVYAQPQEPSDGNTGGTDGTRDPEVIAPDKDGASEDETDEDRNEISPPPGGCQFNGRPLELIV